MRVGVVGYSAQKFDMIEAMCLLHRSLKILDVKQRKISWIVSGLTDMGIPSIAYTFATDRNIPTMGIACAKSKNYVCYPCDRVHIIGTEWGDESETFLASIDVLIRIGGGKQSLAECEKAKAYGIPVQENELAAIG
jgi:hypothetical protein